MHIGYTHLYIWDIRCSGFMSIHWAWMCRKSNSWIYGNIQYVANQLARIYVSTPHLLSPQTPNLPTPQLPKFPDLPKLKNLTTSQLLTP